VALRFLTAGESHGPELVVVLDGAPAGVPLTAADIDGELVRRQRALGAGPRMGIERDRVRVTGGVVGGVTTGGPIAMRVENLDRVRWEGKDVDAMTVPRPGHTDLVGALKYGYEDLRHASERASARETAARVCAGAVARRFLDELGVKVGGYVCSIGAVALDLSLSADPLVYAARAAHALENDLAWPSPERLEALAREVKDAMEARDTLGGVLEVFATGLPPGLGSYAQWDRRLDGRLGQALLSIPGMKGVELGDAFAVARARGTAAHDDIERDDDGALLRATNRAGGLEGGVTNGAPLVARVAMKPLSSTLTPARSVDVVSGEPAETRWERSDLSPIPRAVPIAEAMVCLVLADAVLEKTGGDSLREVRERFAALPRARLGDLAVTGAPVRLDYPPEPSEG
jgi:chorismate synthase